MITGSAAFEQVLAALRPELAAAGFELIEAREDPQAFGSRYAAFGDGTRLARLVWDGRERWFVLEGDPGDRRSATGQPVWLDLTLQRFDPARADAKWVSEVAEDVCAAFRDFAG